MVSDSTFELAMNINCFYLHVPIVDATDFSVFLEIEA